MSLFRPGAGFPSLALYDNLIRELDYDNHRTQRHHQPALRSFVPRFDSREADDAYHLDGELPGIAQKDIDIEFSDPQTLVVKGRVEREYHINPEAEAESDNAQPDNDAKEKIAKHHYWASERSVGEFSRTFTFANRVDQDAVKATLKNGILSIVVPKATSAGTKKITIE